MPFDNAGFSAAQARECVAACISVSISADVCVPVPVPTCLGDMQKGNRCSAERRPRQTRPGEMNTYIILIVCTYIIMIGCGAIVQSRAEVQIKTRLSKLMSCCSDAKHAQATRRVCACCSCTGVHSLLRVLCTHGHSCRGNCDDPMAMRSDSRPPDELPPTLPPVTPMHLNA